MLLAQLASRCSVLLAGDVGNVGPEGTFAVQCRCSVRCVEWPVGAVLTLPIACSTVTFPVRSRQMKRRTLDVIFATGGSSSPG